MERLVVSLDLTVAFVLSCPRRNELLLGVLDDLLGHFIGTRYFLRMQAIAHEEAP